MYAAFCVHFVNVNHDENIHVHPTVGCARQNGKRLTNDPKLSKLPVIDRMHIAVFSSNIVYGNRVASSFELVRGFTPNMVGSGKIMLPDGVSVSHEEMEARRLLARVLRTKATPRSLRDRNIGRRYGPHYVPGGAWHRVTGSKLSSKQ